MAGALRRAAAGGLGERLHMTAVLGTWGLRWLVAVLAVAPLAWLLRRPGLLALRRDVGLIAFVYAAGHVLACLVVGQAWLWRWEDLAARPDFIPGAAALAVLVPAAAGWRRLRSWSLAAAPLAVLHYAMPVGLEVIAPYLYGGLALALLGWRFADRRRRPEP